MHALTRSCRHLVIALGLAAVLATGHTGPVGASDMAPARPPLAVQAEDDAGVLIHLLLPAVQSAREAAR